VDKLKQSRRSKKLEIIGFLLVDLVLLGPSLQSGFDSRPGHIRRQHSPESRILFATAAIRGIQGLAETWQTLQHLRRPWAAA